MARPGPNRVGVAAAAILVSLAIWSCTSSAGPPPAGSASRSQPAASRGLAPASQGLGEPSPFPPTATMPAETPTPGDVAAATKAVDTYSADLARGDFAAAWALLGPDTPAKVGGNFADYATERQQFFVSVAGNYRVIANPTDVGPITTWLNESWLPTFDLRHAVLVEVQYPLLAESNQWDLYIVTPGIGGDLLYVVR